MATTQYMQGRIGQVLGPFDGSDLLAPGGAISKYTVEETDKPFPRLEYSSALFLA